MRVRSRQQLCPTRKVKNSCAQPAARLDFLLSIVGKLRYNNNVTYDNQFAYDND